jgi:hypothetical protein
VPVSGWLNPQAGRGFNKPLHEVVTPFTVGAVAHTKTAYTEIISSTSADCNLMMVDARTAVSAQETSWLIDIAVGSAGSEVVVVSNLFIGFSFGGAPRIFPIFVPIGSRISARVQSNRTSDTRSVSFKLYQGPSFGLPQTVDVLGTDTATSRATIISTNNTWQELVASTSQRYQQLVLCGAVISNGMANTFINEWVAIGASGSETEVANTIVVQNSSEICFNPVNGVGTLVAGGSSTLGSTYNADVPAGTRLAIRTDSVGGAAAAFVIGVPYP